MLELELQEGEIFYEETQTFEIIPTKRVRLEHSLLSASKWESKYEKPFLSSDKTDEEILDYIEMMELDSQVDFSWRLTESQFRRVQHYLESSHTATVITEKKPNLSRKVITTEQIYWWMAAYRIPFTCETWPLNRLLTLIRIADIESQDPSKRKMSARETMEQNRLLNEQRRKAYGSRG